MPITEQQALTAFSYAKRIEDTEKKSRLKSLLSDYKKQQEEAGQPLFPTRQRQEIEQRKRVRLAFQDRENYGLNADQKTKLVQTFVNDDEGKAAFFVDQFLSQEYQKPTKEIAPIRKQYRDEYAAARWGAPVASDQEFYQKLGDDFDFEDETKRSAVRSVLAGKPRYEALAEYDFESVNNASYKGRESQKKEEFKAQYQAIHKELAPLNPQVNAFTSELKTAMGVGDGGTPMPDEWFLKTLMDVDKDKRDLFLGAVAARAGEGEAKTLFQAMFERMGRQAGQMLEGVKLTAHMVNLHNLEKFVVANGVPEGGLPEEYGFAAGEILQKATGLNVAAAYRGNYSDLPVKGSDEWNALPTETRTALERIEKERDYLLLYKKVNDIAVGAVDPAESSNLYGKGMIGIAGMVPNLALTSAGPIGMMANASAYQGMHFSDMMERDPGTNMATAMTASTAIGVGKSITELVPLKIIQGKTPFLGKWLNSKTLTKGGLAKRAAARLAGGLAIEIGEEFTQDVLVPHTIEALADALDKDFEGMGIGDRIRPFVSEDSMSELIPAVVIMSLIGTGAGSIRDFKAGQQLVGNYEALIVSGVSEKDASNIVRLVKRGELDVAETRLNEAYQDKVEEKKPSAQVFQEAANKLFQQKVEATLAKDKAIELDLMPAMQMVGGKFRLFFKDGSGEVNFDSFEEAQSAQFEIAEAANLDLHISDRSVIQHFNKNLKEGDGNNYVFSPESITTGEAARRGDTSEEAARNRKKIREQSEGRDSDASSDSDDSSGFDAEREFEEAKASVALLRDPSEDSDLTDIILGSNALEYLGGVRTNTIKLYRYSTPFTIIEEKTEGDAEAMVRDGHRDRLIDMIRGAENSLGIPIFLKGKADDDLTMGDIKEAYSDLTLSYWVGNDEQDGKGGLFNSAEFQGDINKVLSGDLSGNLNAYAHLIKSIFNRAALIMKAQREGALEPELEKILAESVGFGAQQQFSESVATEAASIAEEIDSSLPAESDTMDDAPFSVIKGTEGEVFQRLAMPDGRTMEGPASFSVIAHHGTPHKVDRFSLDKIGTGEGAQAYGWGLYFAESRDVAESHKKLHPEYRKILDTTFTPDPEGWVAGQIAAGISESDIADGIKILDEGYSENEIENLIQDGRNRLERVNEEANLYTVELDANQEDFLDWDKPLSEQSEKVQKDFAYMRKKLTQIIEARREEIGGDFDAIDSKPFSGWYGNLVEVEGSAEKASNYLRDLGIKGIRYLDGNSRADGDGSYNYVIFDESLVKILQENGEPVAETSFSTISADQDAEYMAAVESGDMKTAQQMVDEAAKAAGFTVEGWHNTGADFDTFDLKTARTASDIQGFFFKSEQDENKEYGPNEKRTYIKLNNPANATQAVKGFNPAATDDAGIKQREKLIREGYDGAIIEDEWSGMGYDEIIAFYPNQIKSADPITYDSNGNVIPLSQRFNPERDEISFSTLSNIDDRVSAMFSPFQRSPELRIKLGTEMKRRAIVEAQKWAPIIAANKSKKAINEARKEREGEILQEKLETLTPATISALESGVSLDDTALRPILSNILTRKTYTRRDGKVVGYWAGSMMSRSAAKKAGRNTNEFDDMPANLPPFLWGGNSMPDQVAAEMGFDSVPAFWEALQSELDSYRSSQEAVTEAQDTIRELEKEAKAESKAWAAEQEKISATIGSDRATLLGGLRTLEAIKSALPYEVRGRVGGVVKLATLKTPRAMLSEIENITGRIDRELEKYLKKEADKRVKKLLDTAKPAKDEAGKLRKGKAGANIHTLFDTIRDVYKQGWSAERAEGHALGLEAEIEKGELSISDEAHKALEAEMVRMFGGWKDKDSASRVNAYEEAQEIWTQGYHEWKEKKAREKEERDATRAELKKATGKRGTGGEKDLAEISGLKPKGRAKELALSLLNFDQLVSWTFGKNEQAKWFADEERRAENTKRDAVTAVVESVEDLFTEMAGGKRFAGEKLQFAMSRKGKIQAQDSLGDTRQLSELEAVTALLMWQQEDGRRHMKGRRGEDGAITSTWSYDSDFIEHISEQLSPEGWQVLTFLNQQYSGEYEGLNAVYKEIYGVNLPQNPNYSPLTMKPLQAKSGESVDPVTGTTSSSGSFTPGSLRTRGMAIAEPEFEDAIATFIAHKKQIEHWKAYAVFSRDAGAILGNREVTNSAEAAHGKEAVTVLRKWLDALAQGGTRDAAAGLAMTQGFQKIIGNAQSMALVGRIGTLAIQVTQLGAAAAKMPTGAYMVRLGKLLSGNMEWKAAFNSDYIQRRLKEQPVIVQQAMEGLRAGKPSQLKHQVRRIGQLIGGADAMFTAGTFAMIYDYQFSQATKAGIDPETAAEIANQEAERITDEVAQPTRMGARSLTEINATNPLYKLAWAFGSESRKNLGLMIYQSANGTKGDAARAALYVVLINGLMASVIRTAWRDARDGEDDEIVDDKNWRWQRLALATSTDWLFGFPVLGENLQKLIFSAFGEFTFDGNLLDSVQDVGTSPAKLLTGESKDPLRDTEKILTAIGLFNKNAAAATSLMHLVRDIYGLGENFLDN